MAVPWSVWDGICSVPDGGIVSGFAALKNRNESSVPVFFFRATHGRELRQLQRGELRAVFEGPATQAGGQRQVHLDYMRRGSGDRPTWKGRVGEKDQGLFYKGYVSFFKHVSKGEFV